MSCDKISLSMTVKSIINVYYGICDTYYLLYKHLEKNILLCINLKLLTTVLIGHSLACVILCMYKHLGRMRNFSQACLKT